MQRTIWVTHETIYDFDRHIDGVQVQARLRPIDDAAQTVLESDVLCHPAPAARSTTVAANGRRLDRLQIRGPLRRIELRGQSRLAWRPDARGNGEASPPGPSPEPVPAWARPGGAIWDWAGRTLPDGRPSGDSIPRFLARFREEFTFDPNATRAATPVPAFFAARRGVCQDYARLAAGCLRARGVPVRFVLGYLIREPDAAPRFEEGQPHAWLSIWDPAFGWRDADPTTGLAPPSRHLVLGRGRRLRDLQPVSGRLLAPRGVEQRMTVRVTIVKDGVPP
jgi:transglutaminase-like putative cysteine protease